MPENQTVKGTQKLSTVQTTEELELDVWLWVTLMALKYANVASKITHDKYNSFLNSTIAFKLKAVC